MARKLSFYDYHRQRYFNEETWQKTRKHDRHVGEFMVGDYVQGGGVDKRGELMLMLYRFSSGDGVFMAERRDPLLSIQICAFDDALGTLRALDQMRVLDKIKRAELRSRDDLARLLVNCGLRDRSDQKLPKET